jgi:hypothetical protein
MSLAAIDGRVLRGDWMKRTIITFLFAVIVSIAPSLILYTWEAYARSRSNITYEIQSILSLRGVYTGKPNGLCDEQTIQAIGKYRTRFKIPDGVECSTQFLESLKNDISATLAAATSTANSAVAKTPETISDTTINARLEALETNYKNTNSTLKNISDSLSSHFVTQFDNLASIGVSAFVTAISIIIAFTALIGNFYIKSAVEKAHEQELAKTQSTLTSMIAIARSESGAHIYTALGNYCTGLYMTLKEPFKGYQKDLYEGYVNLSADLTQYGFANSEHLRQLIENNHSTPTDMQNAIMEICLNNYAYFLAPKTLQNNEGANSAKVELQKLLTQLERMNAIGSRKLDPWRLKDSIAWVKLHLNRNVKEFERATNLLIDDQDIPQSWKDEIRKKHAQHRLAHPDLYDPPAAPATPLHPSA